MSTAAVVGRVGTGRSGGAVGSGAGANRLWVKGRFARLVLGPATRHLPPRIFGKGKIEGI